MPLPVYKMLCRSALRHDGHLNLYFHPWEFSDRLGDPAFGIPRYLTQCSGRRLQGKLEQLLIWLKNRGCRFVTTREYLGIDDEETVRPCPKAIWAFIRAFCRSGGSGNGRQLRDLCDPDPQF